MGRLALQDLGIGSCAAHKTKECVVSSLFEWRWTGRRHTT